ncbi:MAG: hypothetical protein KC620_20360, partial [Myxococcales bacterium]|nr:hypothetical protein [Myxococcales bacterium]
MTLKVIGAGFGRTGTLSTQRALEMLYEAPCYHMEVVLSRPSHLDAWHDFSVHGRPMDWQALLGGFAAAVDFPICNHFETLMGEFPDARVVLNTRDPEAWWRSLEAMISKMKWLRVARLFSSRARRFGRFIEVEVLQ